MSEVSEKLARIIFVKVDSTHASPDAIAIREAVGEIFKALLSPTDAMLDAGAAVLARKPESGFSGPWDVWDAMLKAGFEEE